MKFFAYEKTPFEIWEKLQEVIDASEKLASMEEEIWDDLFDKFKNTDEVDKNVKKIERQLQYNPAAKPLTKHLYQLASNLQSKLYHLIDLNYITSDTIYRNEIIEYICSNFPDEVEAELDAETVWTERDKEEYLANIKERDE